ncbi:hypothetical protein [Sphingopyxis panaciterrulae]
MKREIAARRGAVGGHGTGDLRPAKHHPGKETEIARPHKLVSAHRQAARNLGGIFAKGDIEEKAFGLTRIFESIGPVEQRRERLDGRFDPGKSVQHALLVVMTASVETRPRRGPRLACEFA